MGQVHLQHERVSEPDSSQAPQLLFSSTAISRHPRAPYVRRKFFQQFVLDALKSADETACVAAYSATGLGGPIRRITTTFTEERHTMKPIGSFYPLAGDDADAPAVLFAYAIDTPEQKRALHDEAMTRLAAVSSLSNALLTMQVDDPGRRSHVRVIEAIAILSRDAKGLMEATGSASV
jgi:hypothetical protein